VHRHQRVIGLLRYHLTAGYRLARESQLPADHQRHERADQQEEKAREQELNRDDLVIGGKDVRTQEALLLVVRVRHPADRCLCCRHLS
jgi:hypothetical protein